MFMLVASISLIDHACSTWCTCEMATGRCLHEFRVAVDLSACFKSATILICTIACLPLHASCMHLRSSYTPVVDFGSRPDFEAWILDRIFFTSRLFDLSGPFPLGVRARLICRFGPGRILSEGRSPAICPPLNLFGAAFCHFGSPA